MKLYSFIFLITLGIYIPLLAMKRPADKQLQKKQTKKELQQSLAWYSSLSHNNKSFVPTDLLNIILSDGLQKRQWWYVSAVVSNKNHSTVDVSFSHKNDVLACALNPGKVILFNHHNNAAIREYSYENRKVESLDIYSSEQIATLYLQKHESGFNFLEIQSLKEGPYEPEYSVNKQSPLKWSPSGKLLAAADKDNNFRIYARPLLDENTQTSNYISIYKTDIIEHLNKIIFSPNNIHVACAMSNKDVWIIDIQKQYVCYIYTHPTDIATSLIFNADGTQLSCAFFNNTIQTFNITLSFSQFQVPIFSFNAQHSIWKLFYNNKNELMGWYLTCQDEMRIEMVNTVTNETTVIFDAHNLPSSISCIDFCQEQANCAIGLKNGTMLLLKHYTNPTIEQLLLRKILQVWCLIEKPSKTVTTPKALLQKITTLFSLNKRKVITAWISFPEYMQDAIWLNMKRLIQTYGK